jgi:hypothetical protein
MTAGVWAVISSMEVTPYYMHTNFGFANLEFENAGIREWICI